jgi:glucose/arabinose dehydrogenase
MSDTARDGALPAAADATDRTERLRARRIAMTRSSTRRSLLAATLGTLAAWPAFAQQTPAPTPPPPAETPFYLIGRPNSDAAKKLDVVASPPIPTAADKLPVAKIKVPKGFKVEVFASGILDARGLREGDKGTVFVSSLFVAGKVYAVVDKGGKREVKTIAEKLMLPNGIEFHKGALYVATPKEVTRYDNIEANLDSPPKPVLIYDKLPGVVPHGWKFIKIGPDGKLYIPVGAPCNVCEEKDDYAQIRRINLDGSGMEVVAKGVRNTVGFDWHPVSKELYFTDNGRDWLSEDLPNDELNRVTKAGQHFGYPYCHQGDFADPEFGWGKSCSEFVPPVKLMGAHAATLGMRFYTGKMFPAKYRNAIFVARHGPWNRTQKYAADVVAVFLNADGSVKSTETFLSGLVENNGYLGRPVDVLVMKDGSLLVSDDYNGAIYRVSYGK